MAGLLAVRGLWASPASVTGSRQRVNRPFAAFTELSDRLHVPFTSAVVLAAVAKGEIIAGAGRQSLLEPPVARIPAAFAEEAEDVRLGPGFIRVTHNPTDADLPLEEAERQAAVDPRALPVPRQAFGLRRRDARAGHEVSTALGTLFAVTTGPMRPSGSDTATWAIHGSSCRLGKEENLAEIFIALRSKYLRKTLCNSFWEMSPLSKPFLQ
jgi:hypothetical protein